MKYSLVHKLVFYHLVMGLAVVAVISIYSYYSAKSALIRRTLEQLTSVCFEKNNALESFFNERIFELKNLSKQPELPEIINELSNAETSNLSEFEQNIQNLPKKYLANDSNYEGFVISTADGRGVSHYFDDDLNQPSINLTNLDSLGLSWLWEEITERQETFVSDYYFDDRLMKPVIFIADPVVQNSVLIGMICLEISIDAINSMMYKTNPMNGLGNTGEAYLVGDDFLMRSTSRFDQNSILKIRVETEGVKSAFDDVPGSSHYKDYRGIEVLGSYDRIQIQGINWIIMAEIDLGEAMIPIYTIRNSVLLISVIVSAFIFALAYIISMQISRPIIQLKNAANLISKGKYRIIEQNDTEDEMGELIKAFNSMVAQLEQKNTEIVKERAMRIRSMIDGQETERIRIARELHDGLGQYILAIKMKMERLHGQTPEKVTMIVEEAKTLLGITVQEIRSMSENLIPPVLKEFGLIPAIENLCLEVEKNTGIKIDFSFPDIAKQCNSQMQIYLYRIIQEALTNIAKHSGASEVNISIGIVQHALQLNIADNGHGFSTSRNPSSGNGLTNMRDRAEILGGSFTIHSDTKGTVVNINIPDFYG